MHAPNTPEIFTHPPFFPTPARFFWWQVNVLLWTSKVCQSRVMASTIFGLSIMVRLLIGLTRNVRMCLFFFGDPPPPPAPPVCCFSVCADICAHSPPVSVAPAGLGTSCAGVFSAMAYVGLVVFHYKVRASTVSCCASSFFPVVSRLPLSLSSSRRPRCLSMYQCTFGPFHLRYHSLPPPSPFHTLGFTPPPTPPFRETAGIQGANL